MRRQRQAKIVATLGPASATKDRKLAATTRLHSPDSNGNSNSDLSERSTPALAFINAQLRANLPAMPLPSMRLKPSF